MLKYREYIKNENFTNKYVVRDIVHIFFLHLLFNLFHYGRIYYKRNQFPFIIANMARRNWGMRKIKINLYF